MTVIHLQRIRPNPFCKSETLNGTLCNRVAVTCDGMNVTDEAEQVTCKICITRMLRKAPSK